MLGRVIRDPDGIEGPPGDMVGLGLLDVETEMTPEKRLTETEARHLATDTGFLGYEIHKGRTSGRDTSRPFASTQMGPEGAMSPDGTISGSYLHGMFRDDNFRRAYLEGLGVKPSSVSYNTSVETTLDALAAHLEAHIDVDGLIGLAHQ